MKKSKNYRCTAKKYFRHFGWQNLTPDCVIADLHIKFRQDQTIFEEVSNLALRPFYIWRHGGHFECRKDPILKWAHIQGKLKLILKTACLHHFWFFFFLSFFFSKFLKMDERGITQRSLAKYPTIELSL